MGNVKRAFTLALTLLISSHLGLAQDPRQGAAQPPELAEANRLLESAQKLQREFKNDKAIRLVRRALEVREKALGRDHALVASALNYLAGLYTARGLPDDYEKTRPLYERSMRINEKLFGADDVRIGNVIDALARVTEAMLDFGRAESLYRRALAIREKALGPAHAEVLRPLHILARFYQSRKEYDKAEVLYRRIADTWGRAEVSAGREEAAEALTRYACLLHDRGRQAEAEAVEARAYRLFFPGATPYAFPLVEEVMECKATSKPPPRYPTAARSNGLSGKVVVQVTVDETGRVIRAGVMRGKTVLAAAAEEAARAARFRPTLIDGRPVKTVGEISYKFFFLPDPP